MNCPRQNKFVLIEPHRDTPERAVTQAFMPTFNQTVHFKLAENHN